MEKAAPEVLRVDPGTIQADTVKDECKKMVKETYGCQAVSIDCLPTAGLSLDDDRLQSRAFGDHYRLESDPGHFGPQSTDWTISSKEQF